MKGISTNVYCTKDVDCIKQAGYEFIIRYYSAKTKLKEKVIKEEEFKAIGKAGLHLAIVYQDVGRKISNFTQAIGKAAGKYAYNYAKKMNQPDNSAIYFSVDYDASLEELQGGIKNYFQGVKDGFDEVSDNNPSYRIGVYGSGLSCRWLRENLPFVVYAWLSESTGHRESKTYKDWHIKQFVTKEKLCGLAAGDWETNDSKDDFGQFVPEVI